MRYLASGLLAILLLCAQSVCAAIPATPEIEPTTGVYLLSHGSASFTVTVTCASEAVLRYTTDGSEPAAETSALVPTNGILTIDRSMILKVKAWDPDVPADSSATRTEAYFFNHGVAAGELHALAVNAGGKLFGWGDALDGKLGSGTEVDAPSPIHPGQANQKHVVSVAAGVTHSAWVRDDGTVWCSGAGTNGQLGNAASITPTNNLPVQVVTPISEGSTTYEPLTGIVSVAAGNGHTFALSESGHVYSWGVNTGCVLGVGVTTVATKRNYASKVKVAAGVDLSGIVAISAGDNHVLALAADGRVFAWGDNGSYQLGDGTTGDKAYAQLVPKGTTTSGSAYLENVVSIAAGALHSLAVFANGEVAAWGDGANGKLGSGGTADVKQPGYVKVGTVNFAGARSVAGGGNHSLILKSNGELWGCGYNYYGQLGDGTNVAKSNPVRVKINAQDPLSPTVVDMAAGQNFSIVLMADQKVTSFGTDSAGQLGNGTVTGNVFYSAYPASNILLLTNTAPVLNLAVSPASVAYPSPVTLTLGADDTDGNLAQVELYHGGTLFGTYAPNHSLQLSGLSIGTHQFSLSGSDELGLAGVVSERTVTVTPPVVNAQSSLSTLKEIKTSGGTDDTTQVTFSMTPVQTESVTIQVVLGGSARLEQNPSDSTDPKDYEVSTAAPGVVDVVNKTATLVIPAGGQASLSIKALPDRRTEGNETITVSVPATATYTSSTVAAINITDFAPVPTPVFRPTNGTATRVGAVEISVTPTDATITYSINGSTPVAIASGLLIPVRFGDTITAVANKTGYVVSDTATFVANGTTTIIGALSHTLAVRGTSFAFGKNSSGQLGVGDTNARIAPEYSNTELEGARSIAVGDGYADSYSVVATADGSLAMWGKCYYSLGDGTTMDSTWPVQVSGLTDIVQVAASSTHIMALKADGTVWTWGANSFGQLGRGDVTPRNTPVQVLLNSGGTPLGNVLKIAAGDGFSAVLLKDGTCRTWGRNIEGQLGRGNSTTVPNPYPVTPTLPGKGVDIVCGQRHVVVLLENKTVVDWGSNSAGQLGRGVFLNTYYQPGLVPVAYVSDAVGIAAGANHTLVVLANGTVKAFGNNQFGQVATTTNPSTPTPMTVSGLSQIKAVSAGADHSFAIEETSAGTVIWGWGRNWEGQLGVDDLEHRQHPVKLIDTYLDLDWDGMRDWWEIKYGLDPNSDDAWSDFDEDGLSNVREYQLRSNPNNTDSDGDGMSDGWEAQNLLDPTRNNGSDDEDQDGATNLKEFRLGSDPNDEDTDNDSIPDGWEIDNDLDPTFAGDASLDPDHDRISNLIEFQKNTNPWPIYVGEVKDSMTDILVSRSGGPTKIAYRVQANNWVVRDVKTWSIVQSFTAPAGSVVSAVNSNGTVAGYSGSVGFWKNGTFNGLWTPDNEISIQGTAVGITDNDFVGGNTAVYTPWNTPNMTWAFFRSVAIDRAEPIMMFSYEGAVTAMNSSGLLVGTRAPSWDPTNVTGFIAQLDNEVTDFYVGAAPVVSSIAESGTIAGTFRPVASDNTNQRIFTLKPDMQSRRLYLPDGNKQVVSVDSDGQVLYNDASGKMMVARGLEQAELNIKDWNTLYPQKELGKVYGASASGVIVCELRSVAGVTPPTTATLILRPTFVDLDNDGLADDWEYFWFPQRDTEPHRNPSAADDGDHDGLTNLQELEAGTNPLKNDSDEDGLPDGWEVDHGLNPLDGSDVDGDPDGDGLSNRAEFAIGTNPSKADSDGDLMPDPWEQQIGFNPRDAADAALDADNDGSTNLAEYQQGTNPRVADSDLDGIPDGWEVSHRLDPLEKKDALEDPDGDGLNNRQEFAVNGEIWPKYSHAEFTALPTVITLSRSKLSPKVVGKDAAGQIAVYDLANEVVTATFPAEGVTVRGVNAKGEVVGSWQEVPGSSLEIGGVWKSGGFTAVPNPEEDWNSVVTAVNDLGLAVGYAFDSTGAKLPFLWNIHTNAFTEIETPWDDVEPLFINTAGEIAGNVLLPNPDQTEIQTDPFVSRGFVIRESQPNLISVPYPSDPTNYINWVRVAGLSENGMVAMEVSTRSADKALLIAKSLPSGRLFTRTLSNVTITGINGSGQIAGYWRGRLSPSPVVADNMFVMRSSAYILDWLEVPTAFANVTTVTSRGYSEAEVLINTLVFSTQPGVAKNYLLKRIASAKDADGDGLHDDWEDRYGLNKNDPNDRDARVGGTGRTAKELFDEGSVPFDGPGNANRWKKKKKIIMTQEPADGGYHLYWDPTDLGDADMMIKRQRKDGTWEDVGSVSRAAGYYFVPNPPAEPNPPVENQGGQ